LDLAQQSNIQDAFVIAVEQQARERLERLSALKKIKPVDMNKLSQQVSLAALRSQVEDACHRNVRRIDYFGTNRDCLVSGIRLAANELSNC
jgi:hypothetical protein